MREKYVKGYFALSHLLASYFLIFNVLFLSSIKKFKVLGFQILESWVSGSRSCVLGAGSQSLGPGYWVRSPYFRLCHKKLQVQITKR